MANEPLQQLAALSVSDIPQTPAPNLPLPREVRDQIWSHLLYHKHVRAESHVTLTASEDGETLDVDGIHAYITHSFHFHTAILAVNQQIHKEAMKVLKSNHFIILSDEVQDWDPLPCFLHVPIVSKNMGHLSRMKAHVLRIHLKASAGMLKLYSAGNKPKLSAMCIVGADLPELCNRVQRYFYRHPFASTLILLDTQVEPPFRELTSIGNPESFFRTKVQCVDPVLFDQRADLSLKLLRQFRQMIHGKQRVEFLSFSDSWKEEIAAIKTIMAPSTVWLKALAWSMVENARKDNKEGEALIAMGDYQGAIICYGRTWKLTYLPYMLDLPEEAYATDAGVPITLLFFAMVDAACTDISLRFKLGSNLVRGVSDIYSVLMNLFRFYFERLHPTGLVPFLVPMARTMRQSEIPVTVGRLMWYLCMSRLTFEPDAQNVDRWMKDTLQALERIQPVLSGNEYFEHDLRFFKSLANETICHCIVKFNDDDGRINLGIVRSTSAHCLPARGFVTPELDVYTKPGSVEGFVDWEHFARLKATHPKIAARLM